MHGCQRFHVLTTQDAIGVQQCGQIIEMISSGYEITGICDGGMGDNGTYIKHHSMNGCLQTFANIALYTVHTRHDQ